MSKILWVWQIVQTQNGKINICNDRNNIHNASCHVDIVVQYDSLDAMMHAMLNKYF